MEPLKAGFGKKFRLAEPLKVGYERNSVLKIRLVNFESRIRKELFSKNQTSEPLKAVFVRKSD